VLGCEALCGARVLPGAPRGAERLWRATPTATGSVVRRWARARLIFDVAKVLGHPTPAVTMRYDHFAPEAGRTAIERLGNALQGTPASATSSCCRAG